MAVLPATPGDYGKAVPTRGRTKLYLLNSRPEAVGQQAVVIYISTAGSTDTQQVAAAQCTAAQLRVSTHEHALLDILAFLAH
jgi:hypothetical protein